MTCERFLDLLDPYVDNEADPLNARLVEAHLAECPACSRKLAARRALSKALGEKLPYHRAPASLTFALPAEQQPRRWMGAVAYPLAAGVLMLAGVSLGWAVWGNRAAAVDPMATLVAAAEVDHLRSLQENHLYDVASTDQHTVKPWFAGRLAFSPAVPDLEGFVLKGGRIDFVEQNPAAALVYMHNKHVINLFIWQGGRNVQSESRSTASGHQVVTWSQGGLNYCAISDVEAGILGRFAEAYRGAAAK